VVDLAPGWLANTDGLSPLEAAEEVGRVRTALLAFLAGLIATVGAVYTVRTFALNRAGQVTERFTRAVEHLSGDALGVRIGGIYALERIAKDSSRDQQSVLEVLLAFVRERGRRTADEITLPADVQAAVTVIGRREVGNDPPDFWLNLDGADLRSANLVQAHLERASLIEAQLQGAILAEAHLEEARLIDACLEGASLIGANMRDTRLGRAHLERAVLKEATLESAHLDDASLAGARFGDVTSEPLGAIMSAASARATTATGRALPPARRRTRTGPAHLQGATLSRATYTPLTGWPPGFDPAAAGAVLETQNARTT
jgi:hypothetical protein